MGHTGLFKQITNKQTIFGVMAAAVMVLSTFVSSMVSADAFTAMSITPSSASVTAGTEVQYNVEFTPEENAGAFVIDFCSNTPLVKQSCTPPTGMDVSTATTNTGGVAVVSATANKIVATKTMTGNAAQTILFEDLKNPTTAGVAYARIITYVDGDAAEDYVSNDPTAASTITPLDKGSVSMFFNNDVSVSGTVLETMSFCVSSADINANCGNVVAPTIKLGQEITPGVYALQPGVVSEGTLHTQINTNAASGAVIRLKSSAPCGGLMRAGSTECDIAAALDDDVIDSDNSARFGVKTAAATNATGAANPIGTLQPYDPTPQTPAPYYLSSRFSFNYDSNNPTTVGVTSTFGDPFLDTAGAPATGKNMALTFAASIGTNTPAGLYSTDLNMIAVGKF